MRGLKQKTCDMQAAATAVAEALLGSGHPASATANAADGAGESQHASTTWIADMSDEAIVERMLQMSGIIHLLGHCFQVCSAITVSSLL